MGEVKNIDLMMAKLNSRIEECKRKTAFEKDGDSEISLSSNEDFEIIDGQMRKPKEAAGAAAVVGGGNDEKSNGVFDQLLKNTTVKRRRIMPSLTNDLSKKRPILLPAIAKRKQQLDEDISSADKPLATATTNNSGEEHREDRSVGGECSCMLWKALFVITAGLITFQLTLYGQTFLKQSKIEFQLPMFDRNEREFREESLEETIETQKRMIEKLEKELTNCARLDAYSLPVRVEENRATTFNRRSGYTYHFIIVDWKKDDQGMAQQHLHLAFKQSNASIYVYDHGPSSGKQFAVGDRIIDIDGKTFSRAIEVRDQILWSHHNKDYFTSIIERPSTEQARRTVSTLLQPALSSFSVVLST